MISTARLEIIKPDRTIEFHELAIHKGVTNIGQSPANDIVLSGDTVPPFLLTISHDVSTARLVILSQWAEVKVAGEIAPANIPIDIEHLTPIEFLDHTIILLTDITRDTAHRLPAQILEGTAADAPVSAVHEVGVSRFIARPADVHDDGIITDIEERDWIVNAGQAVQFNLTIVNGSPIVSRFQFSVDGINPDWVSFIPEEVNLNEGERTTVQVIIQPPRSPQSLAGAHHMAITAISPNLVGKKSVRGGTLTIEPYYEFSVAELSPKRMSASYRKRGSRTAVPITNKSNSEVTFLLAGEDEEKRCRFEFDMPDEESVLLHQAEVTIPPGQKTTVPINIEPLRRRLFGFRAKWYSYSVAARVSSVPDVTPRMVLGQFGSRPLIGPFYFVLAILGLIATFIYIAAPRISEDLFVASPTIVEAHTESKLTWQVSFFTNRLTLTTPDESIDVSGLSEIAVIPEMDAVTYRLVGENFLTKLLPFLISPAEAYVEVLRIPDLPEIHNLEVDVNEIRLGGEVVVSWSVGEADEVVFIHGNQREVLTPDEYVGERSISPTNDILVQIVASNSSGVQLSSEFIKVDTTLMKIIEFSVIPEEITEGQSVSISWIVEGADEVEISPMNETYPTLGSATYFPEKTSEFVLTAKSALGEERSIIQVVVNPIVETEMPSIDVFQATPTEVEGSGEVTLAWTVSGYYSKLELNGPTLSKPIELDKAQGFLALNVSKATSYILTAYVGSEFVTQALEIKVTEAAVVETVAVDTKTSLGIIDPSPAEAGESVQVNFTVALADGSSGTVTGSVTVSNDIGDTCTATLPTTYCYLVNSTDSGTRDFQIEATFVGNASFNTSTSATADLKVDPDATGPTVVSVTATSSTIFEVVFNEHMNNPSGDGDANDVTNPLNYGFKDLLGDGLGTNTTCVVNDGDADMVGVTISSVSYNSSTYTATLTLSSGTFTSGTTYGLVGCSITLQDAAGNALTSPYGDEFTAP